MNLFRVGHLIKIVQFWSWERKDVKKLLRWVFTSFVRIMDNKRWYFEARLLCSNPFNPELVRDCRETLDIWRESDLCVDSIVNQICLFGPKLSVLRRSEPGSFSPQNNGMQIELELCWLSDLNLVPNNFVTTPHTQINSCRDLNFSTCR